MKRTKTIKNVRTFLKLALILSCIQLAFIIFSYAFNLYNNNKTIGGLLEVETSYTLSSEQMNLLKESGYPGCVRPSYPNGNIGRTFTGIGYSSKDKKISWTYKDHNEGECRPQNLDYSYRVNAKSVEGFILFLFRLIKPLLVAAGIYFLLQILTNTLNIHPFVKDNSKKLNRIAFVIFMYAFIDWIYKDVFLEVINVIYKINGAKWSIGFNNDKISFSLLLLGFLVLIISSVFKYGYQLKTENDLTI